MLWDFLFPTMRSLDSDKKNAGTAGAATDSAATGTAATPQIYFTTASGGGMIPLPGVLRFGASLISYACTDPYQ